MTYDAVVLVSFGGPEGPDDVMPFLRNVVRGRGVPDERLAAVAEHYQHFGGVSPINAQCRELLDALRPPLELPLYWGNRNWHPYLTDTLADHARRRGHAARWRSSPARTGRTRRAGSTWTTSTGPGPRSARGRRARQDPALPRPPRVRAAARRRRPGRAGGAVRCGPRSGPDCLHRAFDTVHDGGPSGPDGHRYTAQLHETATLVAADAGPGLTWDLVWQSRSGPPHGALARARHQRPPRGAGRGGGTGVVVSPIGFISDHLEVAWDLDTEAAQTAARLGLRYVRAATPGTDPRFVGDGARPGARAAGPRRARGPASVPCRCGTPAPRPAAAPR